MKIVGILDPPDSECFSRHLLVLARPSSGLMISGKPGQTTSWANFRELQERGDALPCDTEAQAEESQGAAFLGESFEEKAYLLGVPAHLPSTHFRFECRKVSAGHIRKGRLWVSSGEEVYGLLEEWLNRAALGVFTDHDHSSWRATSLARMMLKTLPTDTRTRAALWYTAPKDRKTGVLEYLIKISGDTSLEEKLNLAIRGLLEA